MSTLWAIIGGAFALLLSLLGIQGKRVSNAKEKTKVAEAKTKAKEKEVEVTKEAIKTKDKMTENNKKAEKVKHDTTVKIGEAGNDKKKQQDIIDSINDNFNKPRKL